MMRITSLLFSPVLVLTMVFEVQANPPAAATPAQAKPRPTAVTDPAEAGPDFAVQGEYVGSAPWKDGKEKKYGIQIIALGDGKFHGVAFFGGLPGDGWDKKTKLEADSEKKDGGVIFFPRKDGSATWKDGVLTVQNHDGKTVCTMNKVCRKSPTLGAKPPAGAIVLFDGTSADAWVNGRMTPDHLLMEGPTSKQKFQNYTAHVEFMIPFMPAARGQGRGNSGYYAQSRYEVQVLDSFGLPPKNNECGGIYGVAAPEITMSFPPLSWQTYDVDFTAAEFKDGKKVKDAQMTVRHNGVQVLKDCKVPHTTTAAPLHTEGPEPGPIYLQNHGNAVRFRNVWVVEKK